LFHLNQYTVFVLYKTINEEEAHEKNKSEYPHMTICSKGKQVIANLKFALEAIDTEVKSIVQMRIYVVNHKPELVASIF